MTKKKKQLEADEGLRWLWVIGGGMMAYVGAEIVLHANPHSWHWIATFSMVLLGYLGITLWQRLRD